jgi:hypothetical protein
MVFSSDAKQYVRTAYSDGAVWYAIYDIAKLFGYSAPGKAAHCMNCEIRVLQMPNVTGGTRRLVNCNCIRKDAVKKFINPLRFDKDICDWILNTVIPEAERYFSQELADEQRQSPTVESVSQVAPQVASILDALDKFIVAAVSLRRELQP